MSTGNEPEEDENPLRIEPRPGLEVFLNEGGRISIKQIAWNDEDAMVVVHPDDVPRLIELLKQQLSMIAED